MINPPEFKPMLAGKAPADLSTLALPALASRKLDGFRMVVKAGVALSRNLIPIPCPTVQSFFGRADFNGFDGELIMGDPTAPDAFRTTSSFVTSHAHIAGSARDALVFYVFDDFTCRAPFVDRLASVKSRINKKSGILKVVEHEPVVNHQAIEILETLWLDEGYEGLMLRDPLGMYKYGRSTTKEGSLLKLKRFEDDEAVVIAVTELFHNDNAERTGGLAKRRSSKQAGKRGGGVLGSLTLRRSDGVEFEVGSGFGYFERARLWELRTTLPGRIVKYKFFAGGMKDKPRFPTFQGFRDQIDL